jgi:uncharacterized protein (DUF3084 family)
VDGIAAGFVVIMVLLGGLSAYVADILGYKIGKKRLSIWHIRPKYVARISVIVAGMAMPLLTILALYALSSDFRTWLRKGTQAIRELQEKQRELESVKQSVVKAASENAKLDNKNRLIQADLAANEKRNEAQKLALKGLNEKFSAQQTQLSRMTALMSTAETKIRALSLKNSESAKQFSQSRTLLLTTKAQLASEQKRLLTAQTDLNSVSANRDQAVRESKQAVDDFNRISKRNDDLTRGLADLQKNIDALSTEISELRNQRGELTTQADEAKKLLEKLQIEVDKADTKLAEIQKTYTAYAAFSRNRPITFAIGEEVTRMMVPARLNRADAQAMLNTIKRRCRVIAATRKAEPNSDYDFEGAAGFIASNGSRSLTQNEINDILIQQLMSGRETRVAVISAVVNRFEGEPVTLDMTYYPNPIVFRNGDIISEGRVDGRESEALVFSQIREFVRINVNPKAKRVKMVPVQSRDGETYGELTAEQILNAVTLIKSAPRILRLQAVAKGEIRAGDPLTFDLVIK